MGRYDQYSDEELIVRLREGETEISDYLMEKYKEFVRKKARAMFLIGGETDDLIQGIREGKFFAVGLDVYEEESEYFYEDQSDRIIDDDVLARLLSFNNVIVTSHQAFFTHEAMENIAATTLQNIKDFINHKPLLNEVKK